MEGFKQQKKIACFKEGGQVKYESRRERVEEEKADIKQDKAIVKKAVGQHESKLHKGEPKTELKLKTGGRAKKEKGTVKKYCGGKSVKKYEDGGSVAGQGAVSDKERSIFGKLKDNVMGTEEQNAAAEAREIERARRNPEGMEAKFRKATGKPFKSGGKVSSASKRADGCAQRGKTKGKVR